jgi:putative membrane protein
MTADSDLRRTSPLTVIVKSISSFGQMFGAVVILAFSMLSSRGGGYAAFAVIALVVLSALASLGFSVLNWSLFRYGMRGTDLVITSGWLVKTHKSIPAARVQGVDIRAGLTQRMLGLADVVVQTAGGGNEPEARIGSIPLGEAEALRAHLLHAGHDAELAESPALGLEVGADPLGRMADTRGLVAGAERGRVAVTAEYRIPLRRIVLAGATSSAVGFGLAASIAVVGQGWELIGSVAGDRADEAARSVMAIGTVALVVLGVLTVLGVAFISVMVAVSRDYGFIARRAGERIESERGLLERRSTSIPVKRIQTVRIEQAPLRRLLGYAELRADTAGFGHSQSEQEQASSATTALVPIAKVSEIPGLLHDLIPECERFPPIEPVPAAGLRFFLTWPIATTALLAIPVVAGAFLLGVMVGAGAGAAALVLLVSVGIARALAWRGEGYGVDERALAFRWGILGTNRARIARSRIQSLHVRQSPFQRRAGLATVVAVSVSGSSGAKYRARNIPLRDAERLVSWFEHRVTPSVAASVAVD